MMYSDYYAISSCAFSVLFIPFMLLTCIRMVLSLQAFNYRSRDLMRWLGCSAVATLLPAVLICAEAVLAQMCLRVYLTNTSFTELAIIVGYAGWLLLAAVVITLSYTRYVRTMGGAMWHVPRIADGRTKALFLVSSLIVAALALLCNMYGVRWLIYLFPVLPPFLVPFVNLFMKPFPGPVTAGEGSGAWDGQDF